MKKFFLFKRQDVTASSTTSSDSGDGLDILAVSVDQVAYMTAELGRVVIVFNDATAFEENGLLEGESFKKTSVSVACEEGGEADLIESIMSFISSDRVKTNVMRFDAVAGRTNVKEAKIQSFTDVVSELKDKPVVRATGETSTQTFIGGTAGTAFGTGNVISGIDFGTSENKPLIDLNEDNISESGGNVTAWTNAGTGGASYNVSSIGGTLPLDTSTGRENNGLATSAADFGTTNNVVLSTFYNDDGPFTLYMVIGKSISDIDDHPKTGFAFQGGSSTPGDSLLTLGFMDQFSNNTYKFKFSHERGEFVEMISANPIIDTHLPAADRRTTYVIVFRRDRKNNLYVHTNSGNVDAFAPAVITDNNARTDGKLVVKAIGNVIGEKFQGNVPRFGIIARDIGTAAAAKLAKDLDTKYKP